MKQKFDYALISLIISFVFESLSLMWTLVQQLIKLFKCCFLNFELTPMNIRWLKFQSTLILSMLFQRCFVNVETMSINIRRLNFHFQPNFNAETTSISNNIHPTFFYRCKVIWAFCIFQVWDISSSSLFDVREKTKLAKSLLPFFFWILAVASSCVWVFMLFCTMKSETSKLDKCFDLIFLTLNNWMFLIFTWHTIYNSA